MPSLSIRTKLFLTLLTASLVAVTGMHAFMTWSFNNGLVEFAESRQQERLEQIADRLVERYRADGGWEGIRADKGIWIGILIDYARPSPDAGQGAPAWDPMSQAKDDGAGGMGGMGGMRWGWGRMMGGHRHGPEGAHDQTQDGGPPRFRERLMRYRDEEPGIWPPTALVEEARRPGGRPLFFPFRLMLLDAEAQPIQARPELLPGAPRYPLRMDGERIGELALIPGPYLPESSELQFKESQTQALLLIALAMVLLSALFAFPLAHRLTRPVRAFQDTTRRLASGDYAARTPSQGDDELGRLGRDLDVLAQTLEANEQARRRWVADIAHELRTPLALLQAEIEAAQDGVRPLNARTLESLHGDTLRLGRLVEDLHELSMTDLGALSYRKIDLDPLDLLEADLDSFRPRFALAGIEIELDNRLPAPVIIRADGHRLSQLYRNLLRNSLQYTDPGGLLRISLSLRKEPGRFQPNSIPPLPYPAPLGGSESIPMRESVPIEREQTPGGERDRSGHRQAFSSSGRGARQVSVSPETTSCQPLTARTPPASEARGPEWLIIDFQDSPPGVPEEALGHLFERLYRVDASRGRDSGGAGLGLAIAHNIAEAHEGDLSALASPLGGLWIRLRLPLEGKSP